MLAFIPLSIALIQPPRMIESHLIMKTVECIILDTGEDKKIRLCQIHSPYTLDDVVQEWFDLYMQSVEDNYGDSSDPD